MLKTRVLTAIVLLAGLLAALTLLSMKSLYLLLAVVLSLAAWEWAGLLRMGSGGRLGYALLSGLLVLLLPQLGLQAVPTPALQMLWWLAAVYWCVLVPGWLRHKWPLANNPLGWLLGWLLLLPSGAALAWLYLINPKLLLAVLAIAWVADIAAYFSGRTWGKHKLAPAISPGKTWEGAAGALLGVCVYGFFVVAYAHGRLPAVRDALLLLLVLLLLTAISIIGDLFESLVKRQAGVKDSSSLLPGHGGILDRIDSLTSTLPLAALAVHYLAAAYS